jgi:hypothetical protein
MIPQRVIRPVPVSVSSVVSADLARRNAKPIDKYAVQNGGLQGGDVLALNCFTPQELRLRGCQIRVYQEERLRRWNAGLFRHPAGGSVSAPYLNTLEAIETFMDILATLTGHGFELIDGAPQRYQFLADEAQLEHRLAPGDHLSWDESHQLLIITRADGRVFEVQVAFLSSPFHFPAFAKLLAEANGYRAPSSNGGFRIE